MKRHYDFLLKIHKIDVHEFCIYKGINFHKILLDSDLFITTKKATSIYASSYGSSPL